MYVCMYIENMEARNVRTLLYNTLWSNVTHFGGYNAFGECVTLYGMAGNIFLKYFAD